MRGGVKAALCLTLMAALSFFGFITYATLSGDAEGVLIALITSSMLLMLALISWIRFRP